MFVNNLEIVYIEMWNKKYLYFNHSFNRGLTLINLLYFVSKIKIHKSKIQTREGYLIMNLGYINPGFKETGLYK